MLSEIEIITDDKILYAYQKELAKYINWTEDEKEYNLIYYTDTMNYDNTIHCLDNIRLDLNDDMEKTAYIKLSGRYGDPRLSIYKVDICLSQN